jgi:hypothetical protein
MSGLFERRIVTFGYADDGELNWRGLGFEQEDGGWDWGNSEGGGGEEGWDGWVGVWERKE